MPVVADEAAEAACTVGSATAAEAPRRNERREVFAGPYTVTPTRERCKLHHNIVYDSMSMGMLSVVREAVTQLSRPLAEAGDCLRHPLADIE